MATPNPMCLICSRPIFLGAFSILSRGEMTHLKCQGSPRSVNTWPEGIRYLLCLKCGRVFQSDSKAQRLCRACGSGRSLKFL